jgi:hypothetical protein
MFAIGSVLQRNKTAYGSKSEQAKLFLGKTPSDRNGSKMQVANAATINALTGGPDLSNGATGWDGVEQALYSANDKRFSTGSFELHKNTIGWSISDNHFKSWKSNVGKNFKAPQVSFTPVGQGKYNKYYMPNTVMYQIRC